MILLLALAMMQDKPQLPDTPERKVLEKVCYTACHGPENVMKKRKTHEGWDKTISDMAEKGAKGTDEQFDAIVAYLSKYYAAVNVNKAPEAELKTVLEITAEEAAAIVKYRAANGEFKSADDVAKVPGVDAAKIAARKERILTK
jgi:competence protein ComEA